MYQYVCCKGRNKIKEQNKHHYNNRLTTIITVSPLTITAIIATQERKKRTRARPTAK